MTNRDEITAYLQSRGLEFFGIASLDVEKDFVRFRRWLDRGKHASMAFLERYQEVRQEPSKLLPSAKSCIVFGLCYASRQDDRARCGSPPRVAKYATIQDYHKLLRREGDLLQQFISKGKSVEGRTVVDTAPLLERAMAAKTAGVFVGKNTLAISSEKGSYFLLAEVFTSLVLDLDPDTAVDPTFRDKTHGGCGTCRRCQVHCPTGALDTAYELDANRCLSYWTIEHRGAVPAEYWPHFAKYWYGCDICQDVCPYNRAVKSPAVNPGLKRWHPVDLFHVATMSQGQYESWFGGFPMTRAKREGLMRNALIALWATKDPRIEQVKQFAKDSGIPVLRQTVEQMELL